MVPEMLLIRKYWHTLDDPIGQRGSKGLHCALSTPWEQDVLLAHANHGDKYLVDNRRYDSG